MVVIGNGGNLGGEAKVWGGRQFSFNTVFSIWMLCFHYTITESSPQAMLVTGISFSANYPNWEAPLQYPIHSL